MPDKHEPESGQQQAAKQESERQATEQLERQIRVEVNRQLKPLIQRLADLESKFRSDE